MIFKVLKIFALFIASFLILTLSIWIHLPSDRLGIWVKAKVQGVLPRNLNLSFSKLETDLMGLRLDNVKLVGLKEGELIHLNQLDVNIISFSTLLGKISFQGKAYQGFLNGTYSPLNSTVKFSGKDIDLNRYPFIRSSDLFKGKLSLNFEGDWNLSNQGGYLSAGISNLRLSGKAPLLAMLSLPDVININRFDANMRIKAKNQLETEIRFLGDVSGGLKGLIQLNQRRVNASRLSLQASGDFERAFLKKAPLLSSIISMYKGKEKGFSLKITGTPGRPNISKL